MSISLRPISFHWSRMAADPVSAGFCGSFCLASDCAKAGTAARNTVRHSPARNFVRFIVLSSDAPDCAGSHFESCVGVLHVGRRLYGPDVSPVVTGLAAASILLIVGMLRTFYLV